LYKKSIQIVFQQGIKAPDTVANLVWATTNISGYVMHNSIGFKNRFSHSWTH